MTTTKIQQNVSGIDSNIGFFFDGWNNGNLIDVQLDWYAQGDGVQNGKVTFIDIPNQTITIESSQKFKSGVSYYFTSFLINYQVPCFNKDTKILCLKDNKEIYIQIQDIRKNDLVKTYKHGFLKVHTIANSHIHNPKNDFRTAYRLFKYSKTNNTELSDDLFLTGGHSILVDTLTDEYKNLTNDYFGHLPLTDDKYRLLTVFNDKAEPYLTEGIFTVYHIALENSNLNNNYGIFANGLLVETCSINYIKINMTII